MVKAILLLVSLVVTLAAARYIHPKHPTKNIEDKAEITLVDGMPIRFLSNIKQNSLVPVNNILFFKSHEPCEDGMKRDILGICREVWDD